MEVLVNSLSLKINESGIYSFVGSSNSIKEKIFNEIIDNNKISFVDSNPYKTFNNLTVKKTLEKSLKKGKCKLDKINKRIEEALKIVNLSEDYLDIIDNDLDYVNAKKLSLASCLINNPKVIVLNNYTECLNYNDRKDLIRLIKILKNRYKKIIILITKDTSFCYELGSYIYLVDDKCIVKRGNLNILKDNLLLNRLSLRVPEIIRFTKEYKKYNEEIDDYNNILDLIKAIYRDIG